MKEASQKSYQLMTKPTLNAHGYGYGITSRVENHKTILSHMSGRTGFSSYLVFIPEGKIHIVVLANMQDVAPYLAQDLIDLFVGKPFSPQTHPDTFTYELKSTREYLGTFAINDHLTLRILEENGVLYYQSVQNEALTFRMIPVEKDKFFVRVLGDFIYFHRQKGQISALTLASYRGDIKGGKIAEKSEKEKSDSGGFGAWRELAAHRKTTDWVLNDQIANFPILYHWRVIPRKGPTVASESDVQQREESIKYWGNSKQIRNRLEEMATAGSDLVIFLEFLPMSLAEWFEKSEADGWNDKSFATLKKFEDQLTKTTQFMRSRGFESYDYNLSLSFFCHEALNSILKNEPWPPDVKKIRQYQQGKSDKALPKPIDEIVKRYGEMASTMFEFLSKMRQDQKNR